MITLRVTNVRTGESVDLPNAVELGADEVARALPCEHGDTVMVRKVRVVEVDGVRVERELAVRERELYLSVVTGPQWMR